jgi:peptidoglycan/xylan/chitin deacetylase (PgdA/CDA1 family)
MAMRSLVSLTFDDGLRCQFDKALPILDQHGFKATFFLSANQDSTHDLWNNHKDDWWKIDWRPDDIAMLRALIRDGHEIGSHSVSHHPEKLKRPERSDLEAGESKRSIEGWIGTKVSSFCYPLVARIPCEFGEKFRIRAGPRRRSASSICTGELLLLDL